MVLPKVMTRGAGFQLIAANLAVQLAALRQADLGALVPVSATQEPKGRVGSWGMWVSASLQAEVLEGRAPWKVACRIEE